MKHLNPRQGITTECFRSLVFLAAVVHSCETPESPPGDYNGMSSLFVVGALLLLSVKHLNPRQGITTGAV
mgnify:CR=1 FL=1